MASQVGTWCGVFAGGGGGLSFVSGGQGSGCSQHSHDAPAMLFTGTHNEAFFLVFLFCHRPSTSEASDAPSWPDVSPAPSPASPNQLATELAVALWQPQESSLRTFCCLLPALSSPNGLYIDVVFRHVALSPPLLAPRRTAISGWIVQGGNPCRPGSVSCGDSTVSDG